MTSIPQRYLSTLDHSNRLGLAKNMLNTLDALELHVQNPQTCFLHLENGRLIVSEKPTAFSEMPEISNRVEKYIASKEFIEDLRTDFPDSVRPASPYGAKPRHFQALLPQGQLKAKSFQELVNKLRSCHNNSELWTTTVSVFHQLELHYPKDLEAFVSGKKILSPGVLDQLIQGIGQCYLQ